MRRMPKKARRAEAPVGSGMHGGAFSGPARSLSCSDGKVNANTYRTMRKDRIPIPMGQKPSKMPPFLRARAVNEHMDKHKTKVNREQQSPDVSM